MEEKTIRQRTLFLYESPHVLHNLADGKIANLKDLIRGMKERRDEATDATKKAEFADRIAELERKLKLWEDEKAHAERHPDHAEGEFPH